MSITLSAVTFDCKDAAALANFYAQLLERPVDPEANEYFASIGRQGGDGPALMFIQVPDKNPGKNVVHLDLSATDWRARIDRAVSLGAEHIGDFDEYGVRWVTLADPEGNLFDLADQH
ncbi:VOC family protein [Nocardia veterana]|uniref:VOC family protein n=1 Tax=Nocardia veterana TaxID=132249 RepID=A0A7X6LTU6_9NOCA|nr:VOC family protein [Nocardia veterana]NKY84474.1 VOC family protein [Nocardia veterana]